MTFALGTFARGGETFVGLVVDERIVELSTLERAWRADHRTPRLASAGTLLALIESWDEVWPLLNEMADFARRAGDRLDVIEPASIRYRPPILRPGKVLHSAANFRDHVAEMAAYNAAAGNADPSARFTGVKEAARPYLFLKASSALNGAFDDIVLPEGNDHQIDWEAELAVVIGRRGRSIRATEARQYIAGYMTTNDVTRRDTLWRDDRKNFKTDWLASKSLDGFAPMGPLFVPRAFVADPDHLRITLKVNGVLKQNGSTADMIFSAEEQIEYASRFMTLEPGDIFVTGTVGGVGQATGEFLKAGDILETEVSGVGCLRNRIVAPS